MIQYDENFDDGSILPFVIHRQGDPTRRQPTICCVQIANLIKKGNIPCKQGFTEIKIRRQVFDHYLPGVSNITSHCGIFTTEILPPHTS